jgi:hypothetical protein
MGKKFKVTTLKEEMPVGEYSLEYSQEPNQLRVLPKEDEKS